MNDFESESRILRSGPVEMLYEHGFLRYLRVGHDEVVRMIYFALRDENWGTVRRVVRDEEIDVRHNGFTIRYTCDQVKDEHTIFRWQVTIDGDERGTIRFDIAGEALRDSLKNRCGFCVLHPIRESIGQPVTITHPDGQQVQDHFPVLVSPDNPFKQIKAMRFQVGKHTYAITFDGDIFETEDQRNWTDASFKTFCTPLDLPFPQPLKAGNAVHQTITFFPVDHIAQPIPADATVNLTFTDRWATRPAIGLAASSVALVPAAVNALRALNLSHYGIDVHFADDGWVSNFSHQCTQAVQLQLPLDVSLFLTEDFKGDLEAFAVLCQQNRLSVTNLVLLHADHFVTPQLLIDYLAFVRTQLPATHVGAGTYANFTELNRSRFDARNLDFVRYAMHPQEHAFDNLSLIETLEGQAHTLTTARSLYNGKAIHAAPIALRKRYNPYASTPTGRVTTDHDRTDPRQPLPFLGPWTLGSIKKLMEAGASLLTYFQTSGEQGVVGLNGEAYPVYHALQQWLTYPADTRVINSSQPRFVEAVGLSDGQVLLWNYTDAEQAVRVEGIATTLPPYAVSVIRV